MTTNDKILVMYLKGYEDESFGTTSTMTGTPLLDSAYELGASHVLPNRKYNVMDAEKIIKIIRK